MSLRPIAETSKYTGPCLKAARRMAAAWGLDADQADQMTGVAALDVADPERLSTEQLYRISAMLCVWKHVAWRFADHGAAWLREENHLFGQMPLRLMAGTLDEILSVRAAFDEAEAVMLSGYAYPPYPVKHFVHPAFAEEGPRFGRTDGGPGRIATDAEIDGAMAATDSDATPVVDYLRDK